MSLYHGTSAGIAVRILQSNSILPSEDGFFYCFDSNKPESLAGALGFATGGPLRAGSFAKQDFVAQYAHLNPDFPKGILGIFVEALLLKSITASWAEKQMKSATSPLDHYASILLFRDHAQAQAQNRQGFMNEVKVPTEALSSLTLERMYVDDAVLHHPDIEQLHQQVIPIEPLSICVMQLMQQPKPQHKPAGLEPHTPLTESQAFL